MIKNCGIAGEIKMEAFFDLLEINFRWFGHHGQIMVSLLPFQRSHTGPKNCFLSINSSKINEIFEPKMLKSKAFQF